MTSLRPEIMNLEPEEKERNLAWLQIWEIHKQCDNLLHSRLLAFTSLQAFTIAAYTALTVARFSQHVTAERIPYIETGRFALITFGFVTAIMGLMVTFPMLVRIRYLNYKFLCRPGFSELSTVFSEYMYSCFDYAEFTKFFYNFKGLVDRDKGDLRPSIEPRSFLTMWLPAYGHIIPVLLPIAEMSLWISFAILQGFGIYSSLHVSS